MVDDRFRGFCLAEGQSLPFPIDFVFKDLHGLEFREKNFRTFKDYEDCMETMDKSSHTPGVLSRLQGTEVFRAHQQSSEPDSTTTYLIQASLNEIN